MLVTVAVICVVSFFIFYTPTLTADMSSKAGEVTKGAPGYLYGIAQESVPSNNMTECLDISTVSAKVPNGLQHPVGDISHISSQLENTEFNVVYLQDAYSTWYYGHDDIEKQRAAGTYDWKKFVTDDYLPRVEESVEALSAAPYGEKVVYCLYNECDNGAFGEYNAQGEANFFEAWKFTYDFVKSINPNALIGGRGYFDYDSDEIERFMSCCAENDCVPDVMIYHELSDYSILFWQQYVKDYRRIEGDLGIKELPVIVTEYGRMCETGLPGNMLKYITQIEASKVYGNIAYWRLADNLCDVCADGNSPYENWWLYRWYTDMEGQTVESTGAAFEDYTNETYIERYEFEDGSLLGNAYLYNNWYVCTGGNDDVANDMDIVGGMENEGDGVSLTVNVPRDSVYNLNIIYGNSNDGEFDENGRQNPDGGTYSTSIFAVDGNETVLSFENT